MTKRSPMLTMPFALTFAATALAIAGFASSLAPPSAARAIASAPVPRLRGYLISSRLRLESAAGVIETARELVLPESSSTWTPLTPAKQGVVLLGRVAHADAATIKLEYLVVDTRDAHGLANVVATFSIVGRFGEEATITDEAGVDKVDISMLAKPTTLHVGQ